MTTILKERKINPGGSVKKFNQRFESKILNWREMYDFATKEMEVLNKDNVLIEVDYSSALDESLVSKIKTAIELYLKTSKDNQALIVLPEIDGVDISAILMEQGINDFIIISTDNEKSEEERNLEYISKVSQIAKGVTGETYGKIYEISNPENMYENLLHHIENGIVTLNYSAPVQTENFNYAKIVMEHLLPMITDGASKSWFDANYPDMVHFWNEKYSEAVENMRNAHDLVKEGEQRRVLIECAAQHPLVEGLYPGEEFSERLNKTIELYFEKKALGEDVKIYLPGSQHLIYMQENGEKVLHADKISLSLSGANYLIEHGVSAEDIYSDEINRQIAGDDGVYNTGDETYVASEIFKRGKFNDLISVCSPGQLYRALNFFATHGVLPTVYTAPTEKSYHNVINELTGAIPNQLTIAPTWRKGSGFGLDEQIFVNSRNPFDRRNDLIGRIQRSTKYALPEPTESKQKGE